MTSWKPFMPTFQSNSTHSRKEEAWVEEDRQAVSAESPPVSQFSLPRFSLRTLLLGFTAFALACCLAAILPAFISQILIGAIWIASVGWFITGIFFARGDQQAFCIGVSVVLASMWTGVAARFMEGMTRLLTVFLGGWRITGQTALWLDLALLLLAAGANGWLAVRARRYFQGR